MKDATALLKAMKIYTKTGDKGTTALFGGKRVSKAELRIETYGTVDELNAILGLVRESNALSGPADAVARLDGILRRVQNELFNLGSDLATQIEDRWPGMPLIEARHVLALEAEIDELNEPLPELRSFVLPGAGMVSAYLHQARTVCRRAERLCVRLLREEAIGAQVVPYLNRLSDALFVFGRWAAHVRGIAEPLWEPEKT